MPKPRRKVHLTKAQSTELEAFVARGKKSAREINRARVLLLAEEGKGDSDIARLLGDFLKRISRVYAIKTGRISQVQAVLDCYSLHWTWV